MDKFYSVEEFLMLPDSTYELDREYFAHKTGWGWLRFYEKSKAAWEVHGDDGPPVGSTVYYLHNYTWVTMLGVFARDERFFELAVSDGHNRNILIERKMWWRYLHITTEKGEVWKS